jgi:hypothetical protein
MSHNARSRLGLFAMLLAMLRSGGWLVYAEVTEGFAIMEMARAIEGQDAEQLQWRVRQVIAGLLGISRFRFFASGSAERELARLGVIVRGRTVEDWNGLATFERVWGRFGSLPPQVASAGDYTTVDPDLESARACARAYLRMRKSDGIGPATEMLRAFSKTADNRLAPLVAVFELAEMLPLTLSTKQSLPKRLAARVNVRARRPDARLETPSIDWSRASEVHKRIIAIATERRTETSRSQ